MDVIDSFINKVLLDDGSFSILKSIPDNSVVLVVCSPPYNLAIDYGVCEDNLLWKDYLQWSETWIEEIYRVLKPDGRFCLDCLLEMQDVNGNRKRVSPLVEFYNIIRKVGLRIHGYALWTDRTRIKYSAWGSYRSASSPYIYCPYETVIISYKEQWKKMNKGTSTISNDDFIRGCTGIWNIPTDRLRLTPSSFSESLSDLCINLLSYENDIVLDPFVGSGTTCVSAKKLNRRYIGIEVNPAYVQIANSRLEQTN